jgi:RNA polymerase sigma factor (sigma-70 family)
MMTEFPPTQWSRLLELRDPSNPRYAEHLEGLARRYWRPVYHYVRALRPQAAQEAEDLVQQFFAMLLSRGDLEKLAPKRGSFRGFLKTALRHFLASQDRAAAARPRLFPYEDSGWQAAPGVPAEQAFDREWARGVLLEASARLLRELQGPPAAIFREYCLEDAPVSYGDLARRHALSEDAVRSSLRSSRRRLREILRELLSDYLAPGQDVEAELRFILSK